MERVLRVTIAVFALFFSLIVSGCASWSYYDCIRACEQRWSSPEESFLKRECLANCNRALSERAKKQEVF
jgi:hypothetical protein